MDAHNSKSVLEALGHPDAYGGQPQYWDIAISEMPKGILPFLDKTQLRKRCLDAGISDDRVGPLSDIADIINTDIALRTFAWYMYWRVFVAPGNGAPRGAPSLLNYLGNKAGLFYLLLSLEFAPRLFAWHAELGYPREITEETIRQVSCYEAAHLQGRGCPGIHERHFSWFVTYLIQPYVRLGRFEYQLHPYGGGVSLWKRMNKEDISVADDVIALAENNARVDKNGLLLKEDAPPNEGWTATLERIEEAVTGYPVDPAGYILQKKITLPLRTWQPYLNAKDTVLDLHIPSGGGMDWDLVESSFRRAIDFFKKYHPDKPFLALVVRTWFMDPRLSLVLSGESNPLKLQRVVYLYPSRPDPDTLWHIFLCSVTETPTGALPRQTSLQKNVAAFLEKGNIWHGGGMFILPEDMANPREYLYRDKFRSLCHEFGI